jgi:hypothetical protein
MTTDWTPLQCELYSLARSSGERADSMLRSFSGADQADSELYFGERRVYVALAAGGNLETALAIEDARWRAYAKEQAAKVAAAPKIKRGPSQGHSVISHRWVNPEAFQSTANHIRTMWRIVKQRAAMIEGGL